MYSDVEKAFDNGMRYAWNMVGDLFNMTPTERIDALGYSEVNEIVWDADPVEVKTKMTEWKMIGDNKGIKCKYCVHKKESMLAMLERHSGYCIVHDRAVDDTDFCSWAERRTNKA